MKTCLLLDGNNLANRAFYALRKVRDAYEREVGVWLGLMQDLRELTNKYETNDVIWFFDGGHNRKSAIYPEYKSWRAPKNDDELEAKRLLWEQIDWMITDGLPQLGYVNVHKIAGHEADDLVGQFVYDESTNHDRLVIVSTDKDLHQLLMPHVCIYNPMTKQVLTEDQWLQDHPGLLPPAWAKVKAIVGGKGEMVGVDKVGPVYAEKFVLGTLGSHTQAYANIKAAWPIVRRNYKISCIPIDGTPSVDFVPNTPTQAKWVKACENKGFDPQIQPPPMFTKPVELPRRRHGKRTRQRGQL